MKGVLYDYTFTLPSKDLKIVTKLKMKDLCALVKQDLEQYYFIEDITITSQVLYNVRARPHFCSKILKNRVSIAKSLKEEL